MDRLLQYFWLAFYNIFERMKDSEKKESQEAIHARLTREHEKLRVDYLQICAINEMWRQKVREMEERKSELLKQKAERENEKENEKESDNSQ